ncbi:MAG: phosphatase [Pseudonocardiales bacterium]|nr:MAG: phosphatase [Pseudonocardiales bacterium]
MTTSPPTRAALRQHLVDSRIAGNVATTRQNNLENFGRMARREPAYLFGLSPAGRWSFEDVFDVMVARCGVDPDPEHRAGQDTIDPDLTVDRLEAMAARIGVAAARQERVLVCTGHPHGLRSVHGAVVSALAAAGVTLLSPAEGWRHPAHGPHGNDNHVLRYVDGIGVLSGKVGLHHTHSPEPMRAILAALAAAGEPPPDLVVADHGWAGAAGQAGVDSVGYADCNDPALFVGEAEAKVLVTVPLDDNVSPHLYDPMIAYLLACAGLVTA